MTERLNSSTDEWEYEYDHNEEEVFLVDLDLTSVNRTVKSTTANRSKRLHELPDGGVPKRQRTNGTAKNSIDADQQAHNDGQSHEVQSVALDSTSPASRESRSLQFLDFHTSNPLISYQGQVFSCAWTDMIGTTMFFTQPQEMPIHEPEISSSEHDMIGTSRIKLVGTAAKVNPKENSNNVSGKSLGTIRRTNAKLNSDLRKQANFLEQLMNIKKNRGENDNVHIAKNDKISKAVSAGKMNLHGRQMEIEKLNRKAVKGDAEALRTLERIYLQHHSEGLDGDVQMASDHQDQGSRIRDQAPTRPLEDSDAEHEVDDQYDAASAIPGIGFPSPVGSHVPAQHPALELNPEIASNDNG